MTAVVLHNLANQKLLPDMVTVMQAKVMERKAAECIQRCFRRWKNEHYIVVQHYDGHWYHQQTFPAAETYHYVNHQRIVTANPTRAGAPVATYRLKQALRTMLDCRVRSETQYSEMLSLYKEQDRKAIAKGRQIRKKRPYVQTIKLIRLLPRINHKKVIVELNLYKEYPATSLSGAAASTTA